MMKKLLSILALVLPLALTAQTKAKKINWVSVEEAQALAKKDTNKVVMIDVYTNWCGPCKMMSKNTFGDPIVIDYINENFIAVKFNAESPDSVKFGDKWFYNPGYDPARKGKNATHQFASIASTNGRLAYPTLVFLNHKNEIITPITGYLTGPQLEPILGYLGSKAFFKQDYQTYQSTTFKSRYK